MYVVTTPPSFKKIHQRKREKILLSVLLFCAHVDIIKIEKTLMFSFERAQIT